MADAPLLAKMRRHRQGLPAGDFLLGTGGHHLPVLALAAGQGGGRLVAVAPAGALQGGGAHRAAALVGAS